MPPSPLAVVYRELLRSCRRFDRLPGLRSALALHIGDATPFAPAKAADAFQAAGSGQMHDAVLDTAKGSIASYLGPYPYYRPDKLAAGSLTAHARTIFRQSRGDPAVGMDVALTAVRFLHSVGESLQAAGAAEDNAVDTAALEASVGPLEEAPALTPGILLAEHPSVVSPGRALVFVYDISRNVRDIHGDEEWRVRGYVVNRPFPATVGQMMNRKDLGAFGDLTLFHGGTHDRNLAVLHPLASIEGAAAVDEAETLFIGGSIDAINAALASGAAKPSDFKVVLGSHEMKLTSASGGGGGADGAGAAAGGGGSSSGGDDEDLSLDEEDRWFMLAGEGVRGLALLPPQFDVTGKHRDGKGLGLNDTVEGYNYARYWHQNAAWAAAMRLLARATAAAGETSSGGGCGHDHHAHGEACGHDHHHHHADGGGEGKPSTPAWLADAPLSRVYEGMAATHVGALTQLFNGGILPSPVLTPFTTQATQAAAAAAEAARAASAAAAAAAASAAAAAAADSSAEAATSAGSPPPPKPGSGGKGKGLLSFGKPASS